VSPVDLDRFFPPVDSLAEAEHMTNGECVTIKSIWGHMAPVEPDAQKQIDASLSALLAAP